MYIFKMKAFAVTASFRIPESHTFQQTLPLPPITTLTGLMGAAVGLHFEDAMKFREDNELLLGIIGTNQGEFKDLWKYHKIKASEVISDVLVREYLTNFEMSLYIGSKRDDVVRHVRESFLSPCYALSAGNSDDLLKIQRVGEVKSSDDIPLLEFKNTVLAGDYSANFDSAIDLEKVPITETIRAPQVYLLPTAFSFNGSERRVTERKSFTFVGSPIRLKNPIRGFQIEEEAIVLI